MSLLILGYFCLNYAQRHSMLQLQRIDRADVEITLLPCSLADNRS